MNEDSNQKTRGGESEGKALWACWFKEREDRIHDESQQLLQDAMMLG
jgi:hypothetical protein